MKRFMSFTAACALTAVMSTTAFAHSHLGETSPADGETVTEPLQQITLQFDGEIEQGSYIDVISSTGATIEANMTIGAGVLTGTFAEPLPNDTYTLDWSIISADGHPLEGEYSFTVNAPIAEQPVEQEAEQPAQQASDADNTNETVATTNEDEEVTGPSGAMLAAVGIGILALLGGVFYFVTRKD